jgi:O-antigen/teichoic acid export membrane protein
LTIIYGKEYSVVAVPFSLLCVYVVLLMQGSIFTSLFFSTGQPGKNRTFVVVRCLLLVSLIYPAIKFFGLTGAAGVILLASFIALCLQITMVHRTIGLNIFDYVISWLTGLVLAIPVAIIVVAVRILMPGSRIYFLAGLLSLIVVWFIGLFLIFPDRRKHYQSSDTTITELAGGEYAKDI